MQMAAPEVIDLSKETRETEDLYGIHDGTTQTFGKMCLMARRMVERGVRYIHLVDGDWDAHGGIKDNHSGRAQAVDKPIAGKCQRSACQDRHWRCDTTITAGWRYFAISEEPALKLYPERLSCLPRCTFE